MVLALVGCSSQSTDPSDVAFDSAGGADLVGRDVADTPPMDVTHDSVPLDLGEDTSLSQRFVLRAPARAPSGAPVPLLLHAVDEDGRIDASVDGAVTIAVGQAELTMVMRRGVGSITADGAEGERGIALGDAVLTGVAEFTEEPRQIIGTQNGDQIWASGELIRVEGDTRIMGNLRVEAGVWVAVADGANIDVVGALDIAGTPEAPVVFAPAGDAWGGVTLGEGGDVAFAFFIGGGSDVSREFGHSNSQPILFAEGTDVTLRDTVIQDAPGKAMGARGGAWRIERAVVTRTDTGGEFEHVAVTIVDSHYLDFPELDPAPRDDDNDGIYLLGDPDAEDPPNTTIARTTFISGADDGIDHNGSVVTIEESWIEGFDNECIAASSGGRIAVSDTALFGCGQGLEAGYGSPTVVGTHLLVMECGVGVRFGDSYSRRYTGTLTVTDSVIANNNERAVWNWLFGVEAPAEGRVVISRSVLDVDEAEGGDGNVVATPVLADDLRLTPESPGTGIAEDGGEPGLRTGRPR